MPRSADTRCSTPGMIVSGAGTLALTGNNTYTGTITVNAGTLLVNGSSVWSVVGERGDGV